MPVSVSTSVSLSGPGGGTAPRSDGEVAGLLAELASVPDPGDRRGRIYQLPTLLGIMVCAMTGAGHDSFTAIGEWCQRTALGTPAALARLGVPTDPFTGRLRVPDEKTFRDMAAVLDPAELTRAGFDFLRPLLGKRPAAEHAPDGIHEREQRRAHRAASEAEAPAPRRLAYAVDWRAVNAPHLVALVRAGARFDKGVLVEREEMTAA